MIKLLAKYTSFMEFCQVLQKNKQKKIFLFLDFLGIVILIVHLLFFFNNFYLRLFEVSLFL